MDSASQETPRLAYSFPADTFDLRHLRPECCFEADGGTATAIHLDGDWPRFFRHLHHMGVMMVTAAHGPVSLATAWDSPRFESFPGSDELLCLETGGEIRPAAFGGGMAVVENVRGQQVASFQFFDRGGSGCLKLLVTNASDLDVFEDLAARHASRKRSVPFGQKNGSPDMSPPPETAQVRRMWNGLARSLPSSAFPGLEGVSRLSALEAAGGDLAWRLPRRVVRQALQQMTLSQAPLGAAVRNEAVFLPAGFYPSHWGECGCGTTFFSETSQFTLRCARHRGQAWATRFDLGGQEIICLELYDAEGGFAAGVGLRPEAGKWQRDDWNDMLKTARAEA